MPQSSARRVPFAFVALVAFAVFATRCSSSHGFAEDSGGGGDDAAVGMDGVATGDDAGVPSGGTLRVDPPAAMATVRDGTPAELDFHVFFQPTSGAERDVTDMATLSVAPRELGTFTGAHFTSSTTAAGHGVVTARIGQLSAQATLDLRLETSVVVTGAPGDAPAHFGGASDNTNVPALVYPNDAVMVPPNLRELEFHFHTAGYDLFRLSFESASVALDVYFTCPESVGSNGCVYTPDDAVWTALAQAGRGGDPLSYTLAGTHAAGGSVGTSAARTIVFAEEDITGGLYYWNTNTQTNDTAIMRYEFGHRGARAERFIDTHLTGGMCVGCHTLSRDGSRIMVGNAVTIPTAYQRSYRVADRVELWQYGTGSSMGGAPHFASFSPDNAQVVFGTGYGLEIRNGINPSMPIQSVGKAGANEPDWSPDGNHIVYANGAAPPFNFGPLLGVSNATLELLERGADGMFADVRTLVSQSGSENNYYPAFSPDGNWVVFIKSPTGGSQSSGSNQPDVPSDASLWVVSLDGTHTIELQRATGLRDSWPKWDPTLYMNRGAQLFWLTWSSTRAYGLRYADDDRTQLWMAAFDPAAAARGEDPVTPAFRLPFQDIATGNHIGQWVTTVQRQQCTQNTDCMDGEYCDTDGRCYQYIIGARETRPGRERYATEARPAHPAG